MVAIIRCTTERQKFNSGRTAGGAARPDDERQSHCPAQLPEQSYGIYARCKRREEIVEAILRGAEEGINVVAVSDDAYFFLFLRIPQGILFGSSLPTYIRASGRQMDGATKEEFVWGFRVGFITYASENEGALAALEQKTWDYSRHDFKRRPSVSNVCAARTEVPRVRRAERMEKFHIMKGRANKVKALLDSGKYRRRRRNITHSTPATLCA